ncbi:hypothetical protein F1559_001502 [Cyanidiococcus yangmingshanensis]|uniref:Uncharacterized protein n=1 Tax=Cyanidiococcus yangmingshanensis TaxID=2690220 RepID=A0A7J7IKY7_9RHOD|nr:hypothetical protein F1559_001502 [Cyanidiococcus yangmingshanensis]
MNDTNDLEGNSEAGLDNAASVDMNLAQPDEREDPRTPFFHGDWHRADILESPCKNAGWTRRMRKRMHRWIQSMAVGRKRLFGPSANADEDVGGSASVGSPSPRSVSRSASIAQELWLADEPALLAVPRTTHGIDHDRSSGSGDDEHLNPCSSDRASDQLHVSPRVHRLDARDARQRGTGSRPSETDAMAVVQNAMVTSISNDASRGASPPVPSIVPPRKRDECSVRAHQDQAPPSTGCTSSLDLRTRLNGSDGKPNSEHPGGDRVTAAHSSAGVITEGTHEPNQTRDSTLITASRACTSKMRREEFGTAQRSPTMGVCVSSTGYEHDSFASDETRCALEEDAPEPDRTASAAVSRMHTRGHAAEPAATSPPSVVGGCVRKVVSSEFGPSAGETELHVPETEARVSSLRAPLPTQVLLGALVRAHTQRDEIDRERDQRSKPLKVIEETPQSSRQARAHHSSSSAGQTRVSGLRFHSSVSDALSETLWRAISESSPKVAFMLPVALPPFAVLAQLCHRCNAQKKTRVLIVLDDVPPNDLNVSFVQQFALEILAYLRAVFGTRTAVATSLVFDPKVSISVVLASSLTGLSTAYRAAHLGMVIVLLAGRMHWSKNPTESAACRGAARLDRWLESLSGPLTLMMPLLPEYTQAIQLPGSVQCGAISTHQRFSARAPGDRRRTHEFGRMQTINLQQSLNRPGTVQCPRREHSYSSRIHSMRLYTRTASDTVARRLTSLVILTQQMLFSSSSVMESICCRRWSEMLRPVLCQSRKS